MPLLGQGAQPAAIDYSTMGESAWQLANANARAFGQVTGEVKDIFDKRKKDKEAVKAGQTKLDAAIELFGDQGGYLAGVRDKIADEDLPISERAALAGTANELLALGIDKFNTDRTFALQERGVAADERRISENARQFDTGMQVEQYQAQSAQQFANQAALDEGINKMIATQELVEKYQDKLPAMEGLQERFKQASEAGDGINAKNIAEEYAAVVRPQVDALTKGQGLTLSTVADTGPDGMPIERNVFLDKQGSIYGLNGDRLNPEAFLPPPPDDGMVLPPRDDVPQPQARRVPAAPSGIRPAGGAGVRTPEQVKKEALEIKQLEGNISKQENDVAIANRSNAAAIEKGRQAIESLKEIRNHPGRWAATGKTSYLPSVRGSASYDFEQKIEKAQALAGTIGIEAMRGLGAMSEKEFEAAKASIAQLKIGQKTETIEKELDSLIRLFESKITDAGDGAAGNRDNADPEDEAANALRNR